MTEAQPVWRPTAEHVERANVTRLMRRHGIGSLDELRQRSVADPEWFWDAVVADLGLPFERPYERVLDDSEGIAWTRWFVGGRVNLAAACVDRWADDPATADAVAIVSESEDGTVRELTYAELKAEVERVANGLRAEGIRPGDAVGVLMPMIPEAVVAAYAIARVGGVFVPLFSGFAAAAVAARLRDAEARLLIVADGAWRRGKAAELKSVCDEAVAACPTVRRVVVHDHLGLDVPLDPERDVAWSSFGHAGPAPVEPTDSEAVLMLAYTSGTTGKPKGAVHVHGGLLVKLAAESAYQLDVGRGDVFTWVTDMGWIMGPFTMVGAHAAGATMVMYEGAPDFPSVDRLWELVERHRITVLGLSPTLVRVLMRAGEEPVRRHDLGSLRILGSTGEPWNPTAWEWLWRVVGERRLPIINISGGTEVGACLLACHPVEPIRCCSLGGPALGMDVAVYGPQGEELDGEVGELVCRKPWPSMTRGIWRDPGRYEESYWSTYPGVWRHGDWVRVDGDGQWFLLGRSDDAINVAGKRVGPAEVESILVADPDVLEAAVVGVPDEAKGEALWCCWVPVAEDAPDVSGRLTERVAAELGRPFKPARVVRVPELPKTRSGKVLRRAVRALAIGADPGDLSSVENPASLTQLAAALSGAPSTRLTSAAHGAA